jgi:CDP-paratose 2-epimerase
VSRSSGEVLVTGGAGFVGTNLADRLLADGRRVVIVDNLARRGVEQNLDWLRRRHPRVEVELADVRDASALRRALDGVEHVVHLAAQVAVTTSVDAPWDDFSVNLEGTVRLLEAVRRLDDPPSVLFTSTNKVYGTLPHLELVVRGERWEPVDPLVRETGLGEDMPLDFCTPYGCSKGGADQYVLDAAKTFGLRTCVLRMSCIYGPHQHGTEDQGWVAHFLIRALAGETITVYGDGRQVRDLLFVDDLVDAMLATFEHDDVAGKAFVMGGGTANALSLRETLELIGGLTGDAPRVAYAPMRLGDQRWYVADTSRFHAATGWEPTVDPERGIERLQRWLVGERRPSPLVAR